MASSLSNFTDNLAEEIHKIKFKYGYYNKKCKKCGLKYKDCECYLEYANVKDDFLIYKCSFCNKNYQKKFDEDLKQGFGSTYKFSDYDIFCCEKVFINMSTGMIGKNSMKHHYLKNKIFIAA